MTALIASLAELAPRRPTRPTSLGATGRARARARLCCDHLAGTLGLAVTDAMVTDGLITWEPEPRLTPTGAARLAEHGIELPTATRRPRCAHAWTGPSAAPTSAAPSEPRSAPTPWTRAGSPESARAAPWH
ncbi:hypothetical protein [Streptomyces yunnanensis]|uniref:Uncharacterized protein n=1 Tax=Streptomyces yunnanensis TaxID=156453 RepID=A0A9X8N4E1_9ACTN|nr:hypothetical protein SAMN05216268_116102 [Streptomyces yunnanensis]